MTKRPHYDVIIAYANGEVIQARYDEEWHEVEHPCFIERVDYRIKPREFKEGHWYPVVLSEPVRKHIVVVYTNGVFRYGPEGRVEWKPDEFTWIGESLGKLEFPDEHSAR